MKKLILVLIFSFPLIFPVSFLFPQTPVWRTLPASPVAGYRFDDVIFTDLNTGFIINGVSGQVFKTTNSGASWDTVLRITNSSFRSLGF